MKYKLTLKDGQDKILLESVFDTKQGAQYYWLRLQGKAHENTKSVSIEKVKA